MNDATAAGDAISRGSSGSAGACPRSVIQAISWGTPLALGETMQWPRADGTTS